MLSKEDLVSFIEMLFITNPAKAWEVLGGLRKVLSAYTEEELDQMVLTSGQGISFDIWKGIRSVGYKNPS